MSAFEKGEEDAGGQRPYDPRMMLKIWLYGFSVNVRTTRKLEQRVREDLALLSGRRRARPQELAHAGMAIAEMFTEVLCFAARGMARLGTVAIDSTVGTGIATRAPPGSWNRVAAEGRTVARKLRTIDRDPGTLGQEQTGPATKATAPERRNGFDDRSGAFLRNGRTFRVGIHGQVAGQRRPRIVAQLVMKTSDNRLWCPWWIK